MSIILRKKLISSNIFVYNICILSINRTCKHLRSFTIAIWSKEKRLLLISMGNLTMFSFKYSKIRTLFFFQMSSYCDDNCRQIVLWFISFAQVSNGSFSLNDTKLLFIIDDNKFLSSSVNTYTSYHTIHFWKSRIFKFTSLSVNVP